LQNMASASEKKDDRPKGSSIDSFQELRKRALEKAATSGCATDTPTNHADLDLLEELRIHQIELEMQNEELRRAQADLEHSRARYFDLYDLAPVGYITVDDQGAIVEMNLRASTLFGANRSALGHRTFAQSIAPEDQDLYFLTRKRLLQTGEEQSCELRMTRLNLPPFWARLKMSLATEGNACVSRIVIVDVTELKLAEQRFEAFMQFSPAGASIVDENGHYLYVNPAMKRHTDRDAGTWVGKTFSDVWPAATAQRLKQRHSVSLLSGAVTTESETLQVGSQERTYQVLRFPFAGANGTKLVGSISLDITERQRLEELRVANFKLAAEKQVAEDATRAKSQFLSAMSHEIRTPLNGVIGMAGLLLQTDLSAEQLGYAHIVADSAEALLGLVNNILDFSKIEAGKLELEETSFDLECLIEDVLDLMSFKAHEKSLELACWYPAAAPRVFVGDAGRLRQILMNFLSNAIKFTPAGYVLVEVQVSAKGADARRQTADDQTVSLDSAPHPTPVLRDFSETDPVEGRPVAVRISIHDTGIGIPKENLKHLFTRFSQADPTISRRFGGTGLGLSIVKQIGELMGGELGAISMEGEGSTFYCELPLKVDGVPSRLPLNDDRLAGVSVLVSGGQQIARFVVSEWCQRWGMNVKESDLTGVSRALEVAAAEGRPFQMVIIDGPIDALSAALRAVRSYDSSPTPKIVLLSSDPLEKTKELVADAVLLTPVRTKVFREKLCDLVPGAHTPSLPGPQLSSHAPLLPAKPASFKVLVTDDNAVNQKLACALLARLGCEVDTADDGLAALQKVSEQDYGLILMDLVMPEMDGFAATTAIRNLNGKCSVVPIVALTASATKEDREHCFAVGMDDFITKPIRSEQLAQCLAKWRPKL
jgi:PAS domain S-box-containing protein